MTFYEVLHGHQQRTLLFRFLPHKDLTSRHNTLTSVATKRSSLLLNHSVPSICSRSYNALGKLWHLETQGFTMLTGRIRTKGMFSIVSEKKKCKVKRYIKTDTLLLILCEFPGLLREKICDGSNRIREEITLSAQC